LRLPGFIASRLLGWRVDGDRCVFSSIPIT
jgi:hypothetical protein